MDKELDSSSSYSERIQNCVGKMGDTVFGVLDTSLELKLLIENEALSANDDYFLSLFLHFPTSNSSPF